MSAMLNIPTITEAVETANGAIIHGVQETDIPEEDDIDTTNILDIDGSGVYDESLLETGDFPVPTLAQCVGRPPHPGGVLLRLYLPGTGLTESEFAARLGVAPDALSDLLHERCPMTVDMAHRVARVLDTTAQSWLAMQRDCDEWDALHIDPSVYEALEPLPRRAVRAKATRQSGLTPSA